MNELGFTEEDWKFFRKQLPTWQERYMEKLLAEYKEILMKDEQASSRFWELEKRINSDKKYTGVLVQRVSRSNMKSILMDLIGEGAINKEDFDGFSDDFKELISAYYDRICSHIE